MHFEIVGINFRHFKIYLKNAKILQFRKKPCSISGQKTFKPIQSKDFTLEWTVYIIETINDKIYVFLQNKTKVFSTPSQEKPEKSLLYV